MVSPSGLLAGLGEGLVVPVEARVGVRGRQDIRGFSAVPAQPHAEHVLGEQGDQRHRDGHEPGEEPQDDRELTEEGDAGHADQQPDQQVRHVDQCLVEPGHEDLLDGGESEGHEDDEKQYDLRPVPDGAGTAEGDRGEQVEPVHVGSFHRSELRVGGGEGGGVVRAHRFHDGDGGHRLIADRCAGGVEHDQCHDREECDEHRGRLDRPVHRVVPLLVAEEQRAESAQAEDSAQQVGDPVGAVLRLAQLQDADREAGDQEQSVDQLAPTFGPDPEQFRDGAELDPAPLEHDAVERLRGEQVRPEPFHRVEEPDGLTGGGALEGQEGLRRVGQERPEGQHVHAEHAERDQLEQPAVRVLLSQQVGERETDGHECPRGHEVPDEGTRQPHEPPELDGLFTLRLDGEEAEARHQNRHQRDADELGVVEEVDLLQDVVDFVWVVTQGGGGQQTTDGDRPQPQEDGRLLEDVLHQQAGGDDHRQHDAGGDQEQPVRCAPRGARVSVSSARPGCLGQRGDDSQHDGWGENVFHFSTFLDSRCRRVS